MAGNGITSCDPTGALISANPGWFYAVAWKILLLHGVVLKVVAVWNCVPYKAVWMCVSAEKVGQYCNVGVQRSKTCKLPEAGQYFQISPNYWN